MFLSLWFKVIVCNFTKIWYRTTSWGRQWCWKTNKIYCLVETKGKEVQSASKGDVRYDRDNNRLLPSEWLRGDNSELAEKLRRSYRKKDEVFGREVRSKDEVFGREERKSKDEVFGSEERKSRDEVFVREVRKSKEYEHKGAQQANALTKLSTEQRASLGRAQAQHVGVSEGQKLEDAFSFQAVEVHLEGPGMDSKVSSKEAGEGMVVMDNQLLGEKETPPVASQGEKPGEEELTGLKMATVSGKVARNSSTSGLREESSSPDPNPYPSPDDINKDRYHLELEHNLQLISNLLQQKYSAASLRSVTTEMLRVLNATEELIQGAEGSIQEPERPARRTSVNISPGQSRKLNEQLSKLEENVYVAASTVYGLEGDLSDLEACARRIGQSTTERELAHLEDQVASAAAQVQQSELQVTDIAARIAALKTAGLNVAPQTRLFRPLKPTAKTQTIDTSRQQRRRLPAPPTKEKESTDI